MPPSRRRSTRASTAAASTTAPATGTATTATTTTAAVSAFLLNPYDGDLDLNDKEDRKLFKDGCVGLKEKDLFDGKKQNYTNFCKLLEPELESVRLMECMTIPTEWPTTGTAEQKRVPTEEGMIDIFNSNLCTVDELEDYCDLVWSTSAYGNATAWYFDRFDTAPTNTNQLNKLRNKRQLKHVMLGKKLWASLTSDFKIEIKGDQEEFKIGREYDGPKLWDYVRRRVNPTTTVGASKLKDEIETAKLSDHGYDVIKFNTWFCDTQKSIEKDEGKDKYNEYLRSLFRAYLDCDNAEFVAAIAEEKRRWTQGKLAPNYSHRELLELGRVTYNNIDDADEDKAKWGKARPKAEKETPEEQKNFLALATQIMEKLGNSSQGNSSGDDTGKSGKGKRKPLLASSLA